ncbi:MAG: aminotransferase class IV [Microbacteriaceae bacterium]
MSAPRSSDVTGYRWYCGTLERLEYWDQADGSIEAADSWLVTEGQVLALELHRQRFFDSLLRRGLILADAAQFWDAAVAAIPREGDWFPRVELQSRGGSLSLGFRLRPAPERHRSLRVMTHQGADPRRFPGVKGPDFEAALRIRTEAQLSGADEALILSPLGFVIEGAFSSVLWWRGDTLCAPPMEFAKVDSVTAKSVLILAAAFETETRYEAATPAELQGSELWILNALHGIRVAVSWVDGPDLAALPGRLQLWRHRLEALRKPLP